MFDVEGTRLESPACERLVHLNNAGAALMPRAVTETVHCYLNLESEVGGYEAAADRSEEAVLFYHRAARIINSDAKEIAFADSATRAWNTILYGLDLKPGARVLTSLIEFGSNVVSLMDYCARRGATMVVLPCDQNGSINLDAFDKAFDDRTQLVAINHASMHCGAVNPVVEIGSRLTGSDTFYLVDACQLVGRMNVDVQSIECRCPVDRM